MLYFLQIIKDLKLNIKQNCVFYFLVNKINISGVLFIMNVKIDLKKAYFLLFLNDHIFVNKRCFN